MFKKLSVLSFVILAGCASATPYQPANYYGRGYKEQKLDNNKYRVSFKGNRITERESVETFLFYRAAELTQRDGFDYFAMVNMNTDRKTQYENISPLNYGIYLQDRQRFPYYIYGAGIQPRGGVMENTEYEAVAFIKMTKSDPQAADVSYYKASEVLKNLEDKVKATPKK